MSFLTFPVVFTAGTFLFFFAVLVLITAYRLGRLKEKNEYEQQKNKASAQARLLRSRLNDPAVIERLHRLFKR